MNDVPLPAMPDPDPEPYTPEEIEVYRCESTKVCRDCAAAIHARGVAAAPYPQRVAWRLQVGALSLYLCTGHKNQRIREIVE